MKDALEPVDEAWHARLVHAAYRKRGFTGSESAIATKIAAEAVRHGSRTHHAIKALELDHKFGSGAGGCVPGAEIEKLASNFTACEVWNAHRKLGQAVAVEAMESCMALADHYGVGIVSVDEAFHYLWGGGYVMDAAKRGYIAYTNCTAALTEVIPFGGRHPTLGTNPHSWGFPTVDAVGFPIVIDWATSVIAMGRVQQFRRENQELPEGAAVDARGENTTNPHDAVALKPFGAHKGYGLALINELIAGFIGGGLPTLRCREAVDGEKQSPTFFFQVMHPEALSSGAFSGGRSQRENVERVIANVLEGNEAALLPGQMEYEAALACETRGGLLFTPAEIEALNEIARDSGEDPI